jgi:single-strand DNA-binding protein
MREEIIMEHLNRIEIRGRVGTIRTNEVNDSKVANFSLVSEYLYKSREGTAVSETTWFNVTAWHNKEMPEFSKIDKGTSLYVSGRMRTIRYTSAEGVEKQFYEVLANRIRILSDDTPEAF